MRRILTIAATVMLLAGCSSQIKAESKTLPSFELSSLSGETSACKFEEVSDERHQDPERIQFSYFPVQEKSKFFLPHSGTWKVGLVFLDWKDLNGNGNDQDYYREQAKKLSDWYAYSSNHKIEIDWTIGKQWNRLPGESKDYYTSDNAQGSDEARQPAEQQFLDLAVSASDATFDYKDLDVVVYAIPRERVVFTSGTQGFEFNNFPGSARATLIRSDEGVIGNWILSGSKFMDDKNRSPSFVHWAHEMGHMMGVAGHRIPTIKTNSDTYFQNPMYGIGLFADQWTVVRTVDGWNAWMLGWLEDSQVKCIDASAVTNDVFEIHESRSTSKGTKLLVIRTGETSGLVIESRLWDSARDNNTRMAQAGKYNGVVMYSIDSTKRMSDGSFIALAPRSTEEMWDNGKWPSEAEVFTDVYFKEGDAAVLDSVKIRVLSVQGKSNFVRITKTGE